MPNQVLESKQQQPSEEALLKKKKKVHQQPNFDHSYFQKHGYAVTAQIGRGGYGTVYLVKDIKDPNRSYAAKINFDVVSRPVIFLECTVYYLLKQKKCMPKLHDIFCQDSIVHIVLQYFDHTPYIQLFPKMNELQKVKHYMLELLKGMNVLKQVGIYHRDIKPQNFLYNPERRKGLIVDFGLAELDKSFFVKVKKKFKKFKRLRKEQKKNNEEYLEMKSQYDLYKQLYKATKQSGRKKIGTESYVPLESLAYANRQGYQCQMWSAGTIFLQFLSRKYHFFHNIKARNQNPENQFKYITIFMMQLAHFFGADQVKKILQDNGYQVQMPYKIKTSNIDNAIWLKSQNEQQNKAALDLLKRMIQIRPRKRIKVQDAIMHEFFDSVRNQHFNTNQDKQWIQNYLQDKRIRQQRYKQMNGRIQLQDFELNDRDRIRKELQEQKRKKKVLQNQSSTKGKTQSQLLPDSISNSMSQSGSDSRFDSEDISESLLSSDSQQGSVKEPIKQKNKIVKQKAKKWIPKKHEEQKQESKQMPQNQNQPQAVKTINTTTLNKKSNFMKSDSNVDSEKLIPESKRCRIKQKIEKKKKQTLSFENQERIKMIKQQILMKIDSTNKIYEQEPNNNDDDKNSKSEKDDSLVQQTVKNPIQNVVNEDKKKKFDQKIFSLFDKHLASP